MKPDWQRFLIDNGAEFEDARVLHYGNPERERRMVMSGNVICDLSHLGLIALTGEDTADFLHRQLAGEVRALAAEQSRLSCHLNPQGRVISSFRIFQEAQAYYLALPRENLEPAMQRLTRFVLRDRVQLSDASDRFVRIGASGPGMVQELQQAGVPVPAGVDEVASAEQVLVLRLPGPHPRFQLFGELARLQSVWEQLNVRCAPIGPSPWRLLDILGGIPTIYPDTSEQFLPQSLNLDALGAISVEKGCYPGQEIVARMHFRGTLKRRMFRALVRLQETPARLTPVYDGAGRPAGEVLDAEPHPDGGNELLVVARLETAGQPVHLGEPQGEVITLAPPPYPLPPPSRAAAG